MLILRYLENGGVLMQTGCLNLACSSEMQSPNMYIIYFKDYDIEELYFNIFK